MNTCLPMAVMPAFPRNIHLCVVPLPLQDAVQDDEVAVYHLDDPIFLRTAGIACRLHR